ncbi:MAG: ABC transporter permease [bacterium]|nr:ABC transporter permease [bacterium]
MSFIRIYAIVVRQMFLLRHNPTRFFNIFVWVALDIIMWGFVTKYLDSFAYSGFSFVPLFLGAVVLWDFLTRVSQGVMLAFFEDMWSRNFLNLFASPLGIGEYTTGLVLTSVITSLAGFLFMLSVSGFAFGLSFFKFGLLLIPFLLILFIFGLALGVFTVGIVLRFGPSAEWLAWPLPFLLNPFSGVFYPVATLPGVLQGISKIVPTSYVFEGMRSVLFSGQVSSVELATGIALSCFYLFAAYLFFKGIYRRALRNGLLARFAAEGD